MDKKNLAIGILAGIIVVLLGVVINLKRACDLRLYAIANECTWVSTGTSYGDDRDYVCK